MGRAKRGRDDTWILDWSKLVDAEAWSWQARRASAPRLSQLWQRHARIDLDTDVAEVIVDE